MSGDLVGNWLSISAGRHLSYEFLWTGTPTGVLSFQVSNDGTNPFPIAGTFSPPITQPAGGAGSSFVDLVVTDAAFIRPIYTRTSGAGTITGIVMLKASGSGSGASTHASLPDLASSGHPAGVIGDGLLQIGVQVATGVTGIIPAAARNRMVITTADGATVFGMKTTGLRSGVSFELVFLSACVIANGAVVMADEAPFSLPNVGSPPNNIDWTLPSPQTGGRFGVTYYATELPQSPCFLLTWGPTI
jgi:hypothetical protein